MSEPEVTKITKINHISLAKIHAIYWIIIGAIAGLVSSIRNFTNKDIFIAIVSTLITIILLATIFGAVAFALGYILSPAYNLVLKIIRGMEIQFHKKDLFFK